MKKLVVMASVLTAMAASAQTNTVLSKNAVGYLKVDVPGTALFSLVGSPFVPLSPVNGPGTLTLQDVLPPTSGLIKSQIAGSADKIYLWDNINAVYKIFAMKTNGTYFSTSGYATNGPFNPAISLGEGFWLQSPSGVATSHSVYVMGEVPSQATATNNIDLSFQFRANPYPVAGNLDLIVNTNHGAKAANVASQADQIYTWVQSNQSYVIYGLRLSVNRWIPTSSFANTNVPPATVLPGEAFWYLRRTNTFQWVVAKPYTWP